MSFHNNPFEQMQRFFEHAMRSMSEDPDRFAMVPRSRYDDVWRVTDINLDMEPTDDGYVVMADLPGFEKDDLMLRFQDGILTIHGETSLSEETDVSWSRRSRRVQEQLTIPGTVIVDEITASYHNGVLEIHLPTEEDTIDDDEHLIQIE